MQVGANLVLAFFGYLLAVAASSFVYILTMQIFGVMSDVMRNGFHFTLGDLDVFMINTFLALLFIGSLYTAITAIPGFVLTLIAAHYLKTSRLVFFSLCGVLTAILAAFVLGYVLDDRSMMNDVFSEGPALYFGGASGGSVYGLFARRNRIFMPPTSEVADHA